MLCKTFIIRELRAWFLAKILQALVGIFYKEYEVRILCKWLCSEVKIKELYWRVCIILQ